jgi:hypothetical protein
MDSKANEFNDGYHQRAKNDQRRARISSILKAFGLLGVAALLFWLFAPATRRMDVCYNPCFLLLATP